jgi:hypothetical protein
MTAAALRAEVHRPRSVGLFEWVDVCIRALLSCENYPAIECPGKFRADQIDETAIGYRPEDTPISQLLTSFSEYPGRCVPRHLKSNEIQPMATWFVVGASIIRFRMEVVLKWVKMLAPRGLMI